MVESGENLAFVSRLHCGCQFYLRTPSRDTLLASLRLDPALIGEKWSLPDGFHSALAEPPGRSVPEWIEVRIIRSVTGWCWLLVTLLTNLTCFPVGWYFQSFLLHFILILVVFSLILLRMRNRVVEESLLVVSGFGIQTRCRFLMGSQSVSLFVPLHRLRGLNIVERVTPLTVSPYLAAELEKPEMRLSSKQGSSSSSSSASCSASASFQLPSKMEPSFSQRCLLPLLPNCVDERGERFSSDLCLPLSTLVFVLRLIHSVCYPLPRSLRK
ncbi:unnamed protein product [Calicophoron daubneyi]|uniref:Phosphatidylinositol N-acetylglucosaminyltransferase subunit H conserved domain-containing protein n=1 Tax=Calicophoron daubneyi TaxID=300641 RepID=A0AAV2TGN9_CALDB